MEKFKQFELLDVEAQENTQKNTEGKTKNTRYPCKVPCKKCGEPTLIFQKQTDPKFPLCSRCTLAEN